MARNCEKCKGTRRIRKADGTLQPCWDCLMAGEMDQHSKELKDSGLKV